MINIRTILLHTILVMALACCPTSMSAQGNAQRHHARIAIMLPFNSTAGEGAKSLEFYRGMLLAADDMKAEGYDATITAVNEPQAETDITETLHTLCTRNDVVAGFAYRSHMIAAGETARRMGCLAAFPTATYIPFDLTSNAACVFTLMPDDKMIELYAHMLYSCFGKCNVVYVKSDQPRYTADALDLIALLRRKGCKSKVMDIRDATVNLDAALNAKKNNVIVTDTNDDQSISKLCTIVASAQRRQPATKIVIGGMQTWMEMASQLSQNTYGADVYIPTTWCQNNSLVAVDALKQKYSQCFYTEASSQQPSPMLQGYDFARMTIAGLAYYGKTYPQHKPVTQQLLTECNFFAQKDGTPQNKPISCWSNTGLRLIHIKADGYKELIDIQ